MNIFWFRRDLRLEDNVGLYHALNSTEEVLPIFIFDEAILSQLPKDDARVTFIHELLSTLQKQLNLQGKSLAVFHGNPLEVFKNILAENSISAVYTNHDYEPYARKRDKELNQLFKEHSIEFKTSKDQVIFEKSEVVTCHHCGDDNLQAAAAPDHCAFSMREQVRENCASKFLGAGTAAAAPRQCPMTKANAPAAGGVKKKKVDVELRESRRGD